MECFRVLLNMKKKVLMLGWEFPPIINGGLGVACYGIAKELSQLVDLSLIIPKSSRDFKVDQLNVIGLNHLGTLSTDSIDQKHIEVLKELHFVDADLDPYSNEYAGREALEEHVIEKTKKLTTTNNEGNIFSSGDLYGISLDKKVLEYTKCVLSLAENMAFDVIYAHDWMTFAAGVELKKRTGKPLVVHVHSLSYDRVGVEDRSWVYSIEKLGMEQADIVVPVSKYTGRVCAQHYDIDYKKIVPVYNGIDAGDIQKGKKNFPEKLVLFLGRITAQKGPEVFLEIASKVLAENENVRFVMAGSGDQLKQMIENGAYKNLGSKFHFTGFLDKKKVEKLLGMADVYCMPSISEPFGLSALEAVQYGVPSVISLQSGAAEVLKGALKANYWDVDLFANHVMNLLNDEKLRKEIVDLSNRDLERLTWEKAGGQLKEVFEKVN